ncbi:MAG: amino acid permease [Acidobacteria bacterium]|nr:amino acid permease [Acidobacteriota bacterium]
MPLPPGVTLPRRLGWPDAAAIIVSNVIGGGILFTPPQVASSVQRPWLFLGVWWVGGALAFAGAMAYAELATLRPRAGGEYVYLTAAYGRLVGFLTGWTSFVAGFSGAIAVSAVVMASYIGRFAPAASDVSPLIVAPIPWVRVTISRQTLVALAVIALMAWIHRRGIGPGRIVGNVLAALKVSALVVFIALGFSIGAGSMVHLQPAGQRVAASAWLLTLIPVMFTYSGWNAASYVAEEIRDPGRNVPLALGVGTIAVVAVYSLLNLLYLYVMPLSELAAVQGSVLDVIADRLLGLRAGDVMGIVSILSLAASISAMTLAGPRVYYAMARDGLFFQAAARIHPRFETPAASIAAQAAWSGLLVISGGASALTRYTGFAIVLFSGLAVSAVFALRQSEPDASRPFRALGYPLAPAIFVAASLLIVVAAIYNDPVPSGWGLAIMAIGVPLYLLQARRRPAMPAGGRETRLTSG